MEFEIQNHACLSAILNSIHGHSGMHVSHCLTDANKEDRAEAVRVRFSILWAEEILQNCPSNSCLLIMMSATHLDFDIRMY